MRTIATAGLLLALVAFAVDAGAARYGKRQLWGAIAYNSKTGAFGYAVDRKTKREAETDAFRQCGDCDVIKTFRDSCGAIADRPKKFIWETGASREIAERKALQKCGGAECKIAVWACTSEK
jgi:hypothetical protein